MHTSKITTISITLYEQQIYANKSNWKKMLTNEKLEALKEHYSKPISTENELGTFCFGKRVFMV